MKGFLVLAIAATACTATPPADRDVRLARLAADQRQLMEELDDLQARLIVDRQRVRFWQEMRERHEKVSAIACSSQETHAIAMAEHLLSTDRPRPEPRAAVRQVAALRDLSSGGSAALAAKP